jgi:hypothetical protein
MENMGEARSIIISNRLLATLLKQRQTGAFLGFIKLIIGNISPYAGWVSLALIGITSFYTTINPLFSQYGVALPFWVFCVVLGVFVFGMAALEWVFMMPSYYKANNVQAWESGGPLIDHITAIENTSEKIEKRSEKIEEMLKELLEKYEQEHRTEAFRGYRSGDIQGMDKRSDYSRPIGESASGNENRTPDLVPKSSK